MTKKIKEAVSHWWKLHSFPPGSLSWLLQLLFCLIAFTVLCLVAQLCLTLCDPMNYSPPGSSVHGILQARIQEWVAMPSPMGSSWPREGTLFLLCLLHWQVFFTTIATWEALYRQCTLSDKVSLGLPMYMWQRFYQYYSKYKHQLF